VNASGVFVTGSAACSGSDFPGADAPVLRTFLTRILGELLMRFLYGHAAIPNFRGSNSVSFFFYFPTCLRGLGSDTVQQFFMEVLQKLRCLLSHRCPIECEQGIFNLPDLALHAGSIRERVFLLTLRWFNISKSFMQTDSP